MVDRQHRHGISGPSLRLRNHVSGNPGHDGRSCLRLESLPWKVGRPIHRNIGRLSDTECATARQGVEQFLDQAFLDSWASRKYAAYLALPN